MTFRHFFLTILVFALSLAAEYAPGSASIIRFSMLPREAVAQDAGQIVTVSTIADLRSLVPSGISFADVRGYWAIGDGGGGTFRYEVSTRPGTYVDNGGTVILPAGGNGSAAWLRTDWRAINVKWFGARGDGTGDDTPAINRAVAFLRSRINQSESTLDVSLTFPPGRYVIMQSVNMTNIRTNGRPWHVMAQGAVFLGRCAGKAVIDLCRSRFCVWWGGHILGDETSTPLVGMQIGIDEPSLGIASDNHSFYDLAITGRFSRACLYNYASEGCYFSHLMLQNSDPSPKSYCLIQDGNGSDFLPVSDYVSISKSTGPASFNENVFIRPDIRKHRGGPAVYMSRTSRHSWIGAYVVTVNDAAFVMNSDGFGHLALTLDVHCETGDIQHAVRFVGAASQRFQGFRFIEHSSHAIHSIFKTDPGVSLVSLENAEIQILGFHTIPLNGVFSEKMKFRIRGSLSINSRSISGIDIAEFKGRISVPDRTTVALPRGSYSIEDDVTGRNVLIDGTQ